MEYCLIDPERTNILNSFDCESIQLHFTDENYIFLSLKGTACIPLLSLPTLLCIVAKPLA